MNYAKKKKRPRPGYLLAFLLLPMLVGCVATRAAVATVADAVLDLERAVAAGTVTPEEFEERLDGIVEDGKAVAAAAKKDVEDAKSSGVTTTEALIGAAVTAASVWLGRNATRKKQLSELVEKA